MKKFVQDGTLSFCEGWPDLIPALTAGLVRLENNGNNTSDGTENTAGVEHEFGAAVGVGSAAAGRGRSGALVSRVGRIRVVLSVVGGLGIRRRRPAR